MDPDHEVILFWHTLRSQVTLISQKDTSLVIWVWSRSGHISVTRVPRGRRVWGPLAGKHWIFNIIFSEPLFGLSITVTQNKRHKLSTQFTQQVRPTLATSTTLAQRRSTRGQVRHVWWSACSQSIANISYTGEHQCGGKGKQCCGAGGPNIKHN